MRGKQLIQFLIKNLNTMKVHMNFTASDFGPKGHGNQLAVFAVVDDNDEIKEIVYHPDRASSTGPIRKVWISKYQWQKLCKHPHISMTAKLVDSSSIRIYEH